MSNDSNVSLVEAIALMRGRLKEQSAAIERDWAVLREMERLAEQNNLIPSTAKTTKANDPAPTKELTSSFIQNVSDLIRYYRTHEKSPWKGLSHASRVHYDALLGLIEQDRGSERLSNITAETFKRWHDAWSAGGTTSIAHAKIGMVRGLLGFGTEILQDDECGRLFGILCKLKFKSPTARTERLTAKQAGDIRAKARELGRRSIALAQAFQSDVGLLQKDCIGEYVPVSAPGVSDITSGELKWVRGIRWSEIDDNLILRHPSGGWHGDVTFDLKRAPSVMEEFRIQFGFKDDRSALPASGPVVLSEYDGLPWDAVEYRRWWRRIATACGVPKEVRSADSRPRAKERREGSDQSEEDRLAL